MHTPIHRHDYRTVFISDTHLGSRGCQAEELEAFLEQIDCHTLYLVGDFIDFWNLRGRTYWPDSCNRILRRLLLMVEQGTRVIFIPGNHDEAARPYVGFQFGGIEIKMDDVHETVDGRRLFITHGDLYDMVVKNFRLLSKVGGFAYETLIRVNRWYNTIRRWRGLPKSSFSQTIKLKVKGACKFISAFEETLKKEAASRGYHGVVCGHVHKPEFRAEAEGGVQYFNCGDWIEHCSALVEHYDGSMELIYATDVQETAATAETARLSDVISDRAGAGAGAADTGSPRRRLPALAPAAISADLAAAVAGSTINGVPVHGHGNGNGSARGNGLHRPTDEPLITATHDAANGRWNGEGSTDHSFHLEDWMTTPVTIPRTAGGANGHVDMAHLTVADMFSALASGQPLTTAVSAKVAPAAPGGGNGDLQQKQAGPGRHPNDGGDGHRREHANNSGHGGARIARGHRRWQEEDEHDTELAHVW